MPASQCPDCGASFRGHPPACPECGMELWWDGEGEEEDLAGTPFPGRPGYVTGTCGHAVAGSEWRAGFRNCERCGG